MEFMAGREMDEEKRGAFLRVAELCGEQQSELSELISAFEMAASKATGAADRARRGCEQRGEAKGAVEERARRDLPNGALADVSNGNWYAVKAAERACEIAEELGRCARSIKESADGTAAEMSDLLYHLTN